MWDCGGRVKFLSKKHYKFEDGLGFFSYFSPFIQNLYYCRGCMQPDYCMLISGVLWFNSTLLHLLLTILLLPRKNWVPWKYLNLFQREKKWIAFLWSLNRFVMMIHVLLRAGEKVMGRQQWAAWGDKVIRFCTNVWDSCRCHRIWGTLPKICLPGMSNNCFVYSVCLHSRRKSI